MVTRVTRACCTELEPIAPLLALQLSNCTVVVCVQSGSTCTMCEHPLLGSSKTTGKQLFLT